MSYGFHTLGNRQEDDLSSCRSSWVQSGYHTEKRLLGNHGNAQEALQLLQAEE